jgi:hypothetical protein
MAERRSAQRNLPGGGDGLSERLRVEGPKIAGDAGEDGPVVAVRVELV